MTVDTVYEDKVTTYISFLIHHCIVCLGEKKIHGRISFIENKQS